MTRDIKTSCIIEALNITNNDVALFFELRYLDKNISKDFCNSGDLHSTATFMNFLINSNRYFIKFIHYNKYTLQKKYSSIGMWKALP